MLSSLRSVKLCFTMNINDIHGRGLWRNRRASTARHMKRDTSVNLRITSELRAELQRLADADGRKLSGYIVRILELHVQDQGAERSAKVRK